MDSSESTIEESGLEKHILKHGLVYLHPLINFINDNGYLSTHEILQFLKSIKNVINLINDSVRYYYQIQGKLAYCAIISCLGHFESISIWGQGPDLLRFNSFLADNYQQFPLITLVDTIEGIQNSLVFCYRYRLNEFESTINAENIIYYTIAETNNHDLCYLPAEFELNTNPKIYPVLTNALIDENYLLRSIINFEGRLSRETNNTALAEYEENTRFEDNNDIYDLDSINIKLDHYRELIRYSYFNNNTKKLKEGFTQFTYYGIAKCVLASESTKSCEIRKFQTFISILKCVKPILVCYFFIVHKLKTVSLCLELFIDFFRYNKDRSLEDYIQYAYKHRIVEVPKCIKKALETNFKGKLKYLSVRLHKLLAISDISRASNLEEIVNHLLPYIPELIIKVRTSIDFNRKSLFGDWIAISRKFWGIDNEIDLASFICILRHEIASKQWLLEEIHDNYNFKRADMHFLQYRDKESRDVYYQTVFDGFNPSKYLNLGAIYEEVAQKIIEGGFLDSANIDILYLEEKNYRGDIVFCGSCQKHLADKNEFW